MESRRRRVIGYSNSFVRLRKLSFAGRSTAAFLDVYHPVRHLHEKHIKDKTDPKVRGTLYRWDPADPLGDAFVATFGAYPTKDEIGKDYAAFFVRYLAAAETELAMEAPVPAEAFRDPHVRVLQFRASCPFGEPAPALEQGV